MPELVVTDDIEGEALRLFLEVAPRVVALGGGSTPRSFYERLAALDYRWEDVDVLPTDERCVPPDHSDSNEGMLRAAFLSKVPARLQRLAGEDCEPEPHDAEVRALLARRPLDLAVLGLGADGHTASLFPGDPALEEKERAVLRVEGSDHLRLTLTLPVLSSARLAMFLVAGESKREALKALMSGADIPAARVRAVWTVVLADGEATEDL